VGGAHRGVPKEKAADKIPSTTRLAMWPGAVSLTSSHVL
jgi:hypothetical protein